jgi:hypothetical protein
MAALLFTEALSYARALPNPADSIASSVRQLIALAPDGKSALTWSDLEAAAVAVFCAVDADGDVPLTQHLTARRETSQLPMRSLCT